MVYLISFLLINFSTIGEAQVFVPFTFWKPNRQLTMRCESGCYPTPASPFTAALYYIPINSAATFKAISVSNPSAYDFCFGPTNAGGCQSDPVGAGVYPLQCSGPGNGDIDGTGVSDQGDYTAPAAATTDTCNVTDYGEGKATASVNIQTFNPVTVTSPVTSVVSPKDICISQTQTINATGGLGTLNWSVIVGTGGVAPATGASTVYTAPIVTGVEQVQVIDSTTSMSAITYMNVINTMSMVPSASVETPVNSPTFMHYPVTTGVTYVANLNFSANCGLANYGVTCTGGGSVSPTTVGNNVSVAFTPASGDSTSTVTFTDSATPIPQTIAQTVKSLVPVEVVTSWGYNVCVLYSHSSYPAGNYKLKCWGRNNNGQLGYGNTNARGNAAGELGYGLPFVDVGTGKYVKKVSTGWMHTCAILNDDSVKCWGRNSNGQLGLENTTALGDGAGEMGDSLPSVNLGTGRTAKEIYTFNYRTCAILDNNNTKCWGGPNTYGELGYGDTTQRGDNAGEMGDSLPVIDFGAGRYAVKLAGAETATCALLDNSTVKCWGRNNRGQLGYEDTTTRGDNAGEMGASLAAINLNIGANTITNIAAGREHFCARISNGDVKCWGRNNNGQLGKDSTANLGDGVGEMSGMTAINLGTTATDIMEMSYTSCAILTSGAVKCWGINTKGQALRGNGTTLGDGGGEMASVGNSNFGTGLTVKKLAAGYDWGCAILNNNYIKCWGSQYCGTGTTSNGCQMSGYATVNTASNPVASPDMMSSRYIGDDAAEIGDSLPYVNH